MAKHIAISDYTYSLPDARIAQFPLADRAASKLLVYNQGQISDQYFNQIPDLLHKDTMLVFNTTKVVAARILFPLPDKSKPIEIFILEPAGAMTMEEAMHQQETASWKCLVGNNRYFKMEQLEKSFRYNGATCHVRVSKPVQDGDAFIVAFSWSSGLVFSELLDAIGQIPIPPYMQRAATDADTERYQTVYAREKGSVAAPTAGLHFTHAIMDTLQLKGIQIEHVALHVGAGTFRPVKAETMEGHEMHSEEISVSIHTIQRLIRQKGNLIAVGTTSLRTLESLFWIGWKWRASDNAVVPSVLQWDAYDEQVPDDFAYVDALQVILSRMEKYGLEVLTTKTQLLIAPGYQIRSAHGLITNFHQPNSTLLLLVATFIGDDWRKVYAHALDNDYRFLSYGDSSLLWRNSI